MLAAPSSALETSLAALALAGFLLVLGYLVADALTGAREWDGVIRIGLTLPCLVLFVLLLTLAHVLSGGAILSRPWVTRSVVGIAFVGLAGWKVWAAPRRTSTAEPPGRAAFVALVMALLLALVLWSYPTTQLLPLDRGWDTDRDAGLASQLLNGETLPHATVTGDIPNDYPWMHHALLAVMASFMPGGRALHALHPMLFVQVLGAVLALFALGWELTKRWYGAGIAALFGALSGGFGYLLSAGPAIVLNPRGEGGAAAMTYLGDMLFVRSYNMSFNNLAPAFPRDLGFSLLSGAVLLMVVAFKRRSISALVGAGVVAGLIGLTTGEGVFVAVGTAVLLIVAPPRAADRRDEATPAGIRERSSPEEARPPFRRWQIASGLLLPALAVWGLWLGPIVYNYLRYDGFRPSVNALVRLTPIGFVGSWGMTALFALYAIVWAWRRPQPGTHVILTLLVVAVALVVAANVVPMLPMEGIQTLGRQHRYWPLTYLPVALLASLGASRLVTVLEGRRRRLAVAVGLLIVALSIPSPLLASMALPKEKDDVEDVEKALTGHRSMLNLIAPRPGMRCVAAVTPDLTHPVFAYTGYRLVLFRWGRRLGPGSAHVRWRDIYEHIPDTRERVQALRTLLAPSSQPRWVSATERWGVDVVVIPGRVVPRWMQESYRVELTSYQGQRMSVVWVDGCE